MKCRYCAGTDSKVIDSRPTEDGSAIRRRRECINCGRRFTTYEKIEELPIMVVKRDGRREPYDSEKVRAGIRKACEKRPVAAAEQDKLVEDITREVYNTLASEISTTDIGEIVMKRLKTVDEVAYVRFASVYREFKDTQTFLAELQRLLHNLQQAQSYAHYRSLIDEFTPAHYAPARQLMAPLRQLPPAQDLEQTVRDGGGGVAHQVLESTLLNAGPTFSAERPATREQTAIIEGVFTSEPLHRVFFKLRNKEGETCITEKDPVVFSQTKGYQDAKIIRSTYDPAYTPSKPAGFIWTEAETIMKTTIDATPLIKATGIERETFFEQANLPTLLDTIINAEAPYCPPLARAYLFHAILQLILKHPEPEITGIHFCPSLQQDARSFLSIIRRSRQTFTDGMWLRDGSDIDWLNTTYGRWFRERKGKSYAQEIADNVRQLINVRPKFAGLIGLRGEIICSPRIKSRLTPGTRIWYLRQPHSTESTSDSHAGLSIGTMGTPLSRPLPLSPFFIAEKE